LKHEQHEYLGILQENQGEMMVVSSQKRKKGLSCNGYSPLLGGKKKVKKKE
jgi:hypothetical protein